MSVVNNVVKIATLASSVEITDLMKDTRALIFIFYLLFYEEILIGSLIGNLSYA